MIGPFKRKACLIGGGVIGVLAVIVVIVVVFVSQKSNSDVKFVSKSKLGVYKKAAVATNGPECAQIGSDILERNGSAVDAAIAALLCEGIASLHSMGLGGGFLMTIYDAKNDTTAFLDARETAPAAAHLNMFQGNRNLSLHGGLSIAVPGELKGYWEAHQRYGRLPWKDLFEPAIELCETGTIVTKYLENSLKGKESFIRKESSLREILINPATNKLYTTGERIKRPKLAETLRLLANQTDPTDLFYNGTMARNLVNEIRSKGGIITLDDFKNYTVEWREPIEAKIDNMTMYTAPPPGSGALVAFMMNVLEDIVQVKDDRIMWQRIVETFKWAYAKRTELGDPKMVPVDELLKNLTSQDYANVIRTQIEDDRTHNNPDFYGAVTSNVQDHGTAHVSILAPDGSAVSVTSTINQVLGAKIRSESTGIIFNDEMDDFSSPNMTNGFDLPPSPNNYIRPFARPVSSMSPTIVLDKDRKVNLIIGAAGGSKITTAVTSIMILHLWNNYNIKEAIDAYRLHHQLFPMEVQHEHGFPSKILDYLKNVGHEVAAFSGIGSAVTAISRNQTRITANSDYRREGKTAGF